MYMLYTINKTSHFRVPTAYPTPILEISQTGKTRVRAVAKV